MATYGYLLLLWLLIAIYCYYAKRTMRTAIVSYLPKNPNNPSGIDLFLANCSRIFQDTHVTETGLSDFHKMDVTVLKMFFTKQKQKAIFYRNYKELDDLTFKEALNRELAKRNLNNIDYAIFHGIVISILHVHV